MARMIVILLLLVALAYASAAVMAQARRLIAQSQTQQDEGGEMPGFISKMSYVALLILLFTASSGSLGGM